MLFIEGKVSAQTIEAATRLALLEKLQEKGLTPLIRATRLACYEQALLGQERVPLMERELAAWTETEADSPYVPGDVFCFEDFALFLIFGEGSGDGLRAGIIHQAETTEPLKKLEAFCRNVSDALEALRRSGKVLNGGPESIEWQPRASRPLAEGGAAHFTIASEGGASSIHQEMKGEHARALELLEDAGARRFLYRLRETHPGGRVAGLLTNDENEAESETLINKLSGAGLLRREMLVSCRKVGRPLFRLPSAEALNVITASNAICSECGAEIADEKVEDFIKPTDTATALLEDGSWLTKRVYTVLRELGISEKQIAVGHTEADGEGHLMAQVCDEQFLFVLRDGDLTLAHARRTFDKLSETGGAHLVLVTTGEVQDEARVRLREHARRRARSGSEVQVILIENLDTLAADIQQAFERVSHQAVTEELCQLDTSLGLSVGHIITIRFRLMQNHPGTLKDHAQSTVGTLAGSLREI
ncbi:MAG TPA: hypothetical protein VGO91_11855 [Pyrinomonadaceae bacterium]|nr:hypothetical protein [Pyrinomonadaceae bacterium]